MWNDQNELQCGKDQSNDRNEIQYGKADAEGL